MKTAQSKTTSKKPLCNSESRIVQFFSGLSDRDKLLLSTYDWLGVLSMNVSNDKFYDKINDAVESFDPDDIGQDEDLKWLIEIREMAKLASNG